VCVCVCRERETDRQERLESIHEQILETGRESTRLHNVENLLWRGQINFNLPTYFILLIIDHIFVLIYSFLHIHIFYIVSTIICIFYKLLYISVKEEISFSKVNR